MSTVRAVVVAAGVVASPAMATITLIDFSVHSDTVDNFRFSVIHSASTNNNQGGDIFSELTGTFRVALDDQGTADLADDMIEILSFNGVLGGGTIGQARALAIDGTSLFSPIEDAGVSLISGGLSVAVDFGSGNAGSIVYSFDATDFNSLANRLFRPGTTVPGITTLASDQYAIGLWGLGTVTSGDPFGDGIVGLDLFGLGTVVPTPASAMLMLVGLGVGTRRRR